MGRFGVDTPEDESSRTTAWLDEIHAQAVGKAALSPLQLLETAEFGDVNPTMVQNALNTITSVSATSATDSEVVLGIAVHAAEAQKPRLAAEWDEVVDHARSIWRAATDSTVSN